MRRAQLLLLTVILVPACHDAGAEAFAHANARYEALSHAGTPIRSIDYDAVLADLRAVPSGASKSKADSIIQTIEEARKAAPPIPVTHTLTLDEELANARIECDGLKAQLAPLQGEARKAKMELLDACRRRAADLEAQLPPTDAGTTP